MRWPLQFVALLGFIWLAGCFSGRAIEQSLSASAAAAQYHSMHGSWPESREALFAFDAEALPVRLHKKDEVWLRQNNDGSATLTFIANEWWGGNAMVIRIVPSSTVPSEEGSGARSSKPSDDSIGDYTVDLETYPKSLGKRLK